MGGEGRIHTALGELDLRGRDGLLLRSDGPMNAVTDHEICVVVLSSSDLGDACERLVGLANDRGGEDDITVLAGSVGGDLASSVAGDAVGQTFAILATLDPPVR